MMMKLDEFFVKDEMENASSILIPPLLKELKESHPPRFSIRDLQPFHKDLRFVGYGVSYLDNKPEVLQTRVIKTKGAMYAQLTVGVRAVEVRRWRLAVICRMCMDGLLVESVFSLRRSSPL